MTIDIDDISPRKQYTATSAQTVFIYDFPIEDQDDLLVYLTPVGNDPSDVSDILTIAVDYTVTGVGAEGGGTIVLVVGATTDDKITIQRSMPLARDAVFSADAAIPSAVLDEEFNNLLMMVQQVDLKIEKLQTKYQNAETIDTTVDRRLPKLAAKQTWRMNTAGTGIEALTVDESGEADTLRADLADDQLGSDGARLIGYFSPTFGASTVKADLDKLISEYVQIGLNTPPGVIYEYAGGTNPTGFLLCNGNAISRATYSALFAVIGTTYGVGDGSTTFNLPDKQGRIGVGAGSGSGLTQRIRGQMSGTETHALIEAELAVHTHNPLFNGTPIPGNTVEGVLSGEPLSDSDKGGGAGLTSRATLTLSSTGSGTAHNNMQPYTVMNYIIKT